VIGGGAPGDGNLIAFNGAPGSGFFHAGVQVFSTGSVIRGNAIHSNTGLGIDVSSGGVTPNDNCDSDFGPNNFQNFPVLTSATSSGTSVTLAGTLNSAASTMFTLDLYASVACDSSGNGEGETYLGSTTVTTDAGCNGAFNITFNAAVPVGRFITATATNPSGNTSEFSACVQVACGYAVSPVTQFFLMNGGSGSVNVLAGGSSCNWMASTEDAWITITSSDSGNGNDTITFEVRDNFTGSARQGAITVSGQTFTIVQDGGLGDNCDYSISPKFSSFSGAGGTGIVNVSSAERCAWQAVSGANWITITSGSAGIGNGTVGYTVGANPTPTGRAATITVAGKSFAVKQTGS
jgi:hypothetical protein